MGTRSKSTNRSKNGTHCVAGHRIKCGGVPDFSRRKSTLTPGTVVKSSKGVRYVVQGDGSWKRQG